MLIYKRDYNYVFLMIKLLQSKSLNDRRKKGKEINWENEVEEQILKKYSYIISYRSRLVYYDYVVRIVNLNVLK